MSNAGLPTREQKEGDGRRCALTVALFSTASFAVGTSLGALLTVAVFAVVGLWY